MKQTIIISVAIVCVTIIELYALYQGINGLALAGALTIIGGLAGFNIKAIHSKKKGGGS